MYQTICGIWVSSVICDIDFPIGEKRKRSGSVLWKKALTPTENPKSNVTLQKRRQNRMRTKDLNEENNFFFLFLGAIIAEALIPVFGTELAKKLGKQVQKEAVAKAKEAAKVAGQRKAEVLKRSMESRLKPVVDQVMTANKGQMDVIAKYAAQQMMDMVVPPGSRKGNRSQVALPAGVTLAQIALAWMQNESSNMLIGWDRCLRKFGEIWRKRNPYIDLMPNDNIKHINWPFYRIRIWYFYLTCKRIS